MSGAVRGIVAESSSQLRQLGNDMSALGTKMTIGLTAPLVGAAGAGLKFGSDFETAMTKVSTIAGATVEQAKAIRASIMALAPETGQGPLALAEAMVKIPLAALSAKDAQDVLTASARAAAIGLGEAKEVALLLTGVMKAYGSENITATRATEIMLSTVQEGNVEVGELAGVLGRVVGIAATVGISFEELGGFIATFSRLGVDAGESVTALRGIITTLLGPSKQAKDTLKEFGTSIDDVKSAVKEKGLTAAMMDLMGLFKGNEDALDGVFGNVRALAGVMGVFTAQGKDVSGVLENIKERTGNVDAAFKQFKETTNFKWSQFTAEMQTMAIALGDSLAPSFKALLEASKPIIDVVVSLIKGFSELPGPVQTGVIAFLSLVAVAGPTLVVLGQLLSLFGALGGAVAWIMEFASAVGAFGLAEAAMAWIPGATLAVEAFGGVLAVMTGPIGLVVAAVVGLGLVWMTWGDDIKRVVGEAYAAVKEWLWDKFEPVLTPIIGLLQSIGEMFEAFGRLVGAVVERVYTVARDWIYDKLVGVFNFLHDGVIKVRDLVLKMPDWMLALTGPVGLVVIAFKHWDQITTVVTNVYNAVKHWLIDKFTDIVDGIKGKIDSVTGFFNNMYEKVVGHSIVPDMVREIGLTIDKLDDNFVDRVHGQTTKATGHFAFMQTAIMDVVHGWVTELEGVIDRGMQKIFGKDGPMGKVGELAAAVLSAALNYAISRAMSSIMGAIFGTAAGGAGGAGAAGAAGGGISAGAIGAAAGYAVIPALLAALIWNPGPTDPGQNQVQDLAAAQSAFDNLIMQGQDPLEGGNNFTQFMAQHPWLWGMGQGFKDGGIVRPTGLDPADTVPIWAQPGERVLSVPETQAYDRMAAFGSAAGTTVHIHVNVDRPVMMDKRMVGELSDRLVRRIPGDLRKRGL